MFGIIDESRGYLFRSYDLSQALQGFQQKMRDGHCRFGCLLCGEVQGRTDHTETHEWYTDKVQIDVRHDQMRWIDDRSRPALVAGKRTEVRIPFERQSGLFYSQSNMMTSSTPQAVIEGNELVLRYDRPSNAPRDVRPLIDQTVHEIEKHFGWQRPMIDALDVALSGLAQQVIYNRRSRILTRSKRAAALGIPVKRRDNAPQTYAIPTARSQAAPTLPPSSSTQFEPAPTWAMELYEQAEDYARYGTCDGKKPGSFQGDE